MHEHVLAGCRPVPLADYLKALGVLRLVGEQADPAARAWWHGEKFVLRTKLERSELERFFLDSYCPTPIVAPWNGGSGFYRKDNKQAISKILSSKADRFQGYRNTIECTMGVLSDLNLDEKVPPDLKPRLLEACRARLNDDALAWLDAAYLLSAQGPKYPPLLGTGGNDGRLDFTNNFMQRLLDVVDASGNPTAPSGELIRAALFDESTNLLSGGAIGQFFPAGAGGANAAAGFDGDSVFNPWDFVLMLEGAASFAVAAVRRFEQDTEDALSYPFTVRPSGVGYASAADADEAASRGEMWLPLWERPAGSGEIRALLAEGRARVSGRTARNGVDFARAAATLGVDRGITAFQRYGFQVRNGLSYLAIPLGRIRVHRQVRAELLDEIDRWLHTFRRRANGDRAPASGRRALGRLEAAIMDLCRRGGPDRVQDVLVSLGRCEHAMARSLRWTLETRLRPVPSLSYRWLEACDDGSPELRLAIALASTYAKLGKTVLPLRSQFEPVCTSIAQGRLRAEWDKDAARDVAWSDGDVVTALNGVLARRIVRFEQGGAGSYVDQAWISAHLVDVLLFLDGRTDDAKLADLLWGALLLDWPSGTVGPGERRFTASSEEARDVPALYALLKLCFAGSSDGAESADPIPLVPRIHRLAARGDGTEASRVATRRLRASGKMPALPFVHARGDSSRRAAAAVLFPLGKRSLAELANVVLRRTQPGESTT